MNVGRPFGMNQVRMVVNKHASWPALLDSAGADPLLVNEVIREMALLQLLRDLYGNTGFKEENIIDMLQQASEQSKFERHRQMASSILYVLTRFSPGMPLPSFSLRNAAGDTASPADFSGKYLYLHFFTTWNVASLEEMLDLAEELGVRIYVCEMSMDLMGFKREEIIDYKHLGFAGVATFLQEAANSKVQLFI